MSPMHTLSVKKKYRTEYSVTSHRQLHLSPLPHDCERKVSSDCKQGKGATQENRKSLCLFVGTPSELEVDSKIDMSHCAPFLVGAHTHCGNCNCATVLRSGSASVQSLQTVLVLLEDWKIEFTWKAVENILAVKALKISKYVTNV